MRNKRAKQLRNDAELATIGKSAKVTRKLYRKFKKQYTRTRTFSLENAETK
jgi:hypothetical protein